MTIRNVEGNEIKGWKGLYDITIKACRSRDIIVSSASTHIIHSDIEKRAEGKVLAQQLIPGIGIMEAGLPIELD